MPPTKITITAKRSLAFFAVLAMAMVLASYVLVAALAAACVYFPYLAMEHSEQAHVQLVALFLGGVAIAGAMLWSLVPRREPFKPPGPLLTRAEHPRLFAELDEIAGALNERVPRDVYLIGDVNAFVSDRGGLLGFSSRRILAIGLPLLSILTLSEFRGVLAHEFGHYYSGDTRMGPWVYKTQTAMMRTFQNIQTIGGFARIAIVGAMYATVIFVLKQYFLLFSRVINFVSRRKEYRADELACIVGGTRPFLASLRKIHGASPAWPTYWNTEVVPVLNCNFRPDIADGFARFLVAPEISVQVEAGLAKQLKEAKADPHSTHPPLRSRIAAIERSSVRAPDEDTTPALSLLDRPEAAELAFLEWFNPQLEKGALLQVGWEEIGARVIIPSWKSAVTQNAALLQGVTAESIPDLIPKLGAVGARLGDPKGRLLTPQQRAQRAGQFVGMALALALLEKGWRLENQPGIFYFHRGDERINVFGMMSELIDGKISRERWVARCAELGIAQSALVSEPAAVSPASAAS